MLQNASAPNLHEDSLTFLDANGNPKTLPVGPLIARDMTGIYEVKAAGSEKARYVQFLRTGTAILIAPDGQFHNAIWRTNGEAMIVTEVDGSELRWPRESLIAVSGVPAGTRLVVRLMEPLSSEKTKEGDPVQAVLISPGTINNAILIPQGSIVSGTVTHAHGVGWGLRHETAALTLEFTSAKLPDGSELTIHTRLDNVENSRETVTPQGKIQGVRATGTAAHMAEKKIASVASIDPVAYLFTNVGLSVKARIFSATATPGSTSPASTTTCSNFASPLTPSTGTNGSRRESGLRFENAGVNIGEEVPLRQALNVRAFFTY